MARQGADLKKKIEELKRALRAEPARHKVRLERGAKHTKVYDRKNGRVITTLPDTPSDYRSFANCVAKLRRARVFEKAGYEQRSDRFPLSQELQHDALHLLDLLGYKAVPHGKGVFQGGALSKLSKYMMEAAEEFGVRRGRPLNSFQSFVSNVVIGGSMASPENIDLLERAVEIGMAKITDQPKPPVSEPEIEIETMLGPKQPLKWVYTSGSGDLHATPVYEEVGPLYEETPVETTPSNGKVNVESLHLRVLAAILDHNTTTEQAMALAVEIAHLEGH